MTIDERIPSLWEFLERENPRAQNTEDLYKWGLNFDTHNNPFLLFLDLIGWNEEQYGERLGQSVTLGYAEADYLADALKEWAENPFAVDSWLVDLMAVEAEGQ